MSDLRVDPERAEWLRALRSMNDAYVLRLLDEHTRLVQAAAWDEGYAMGYRTPQGRGHTTYDNPYRQHPGTEGDDK